MESVHPSIHPYVSFSFDVIYSDLARRCRSTHPKENQRRGVCVGEGGELTAGNFIQLLTVCQARELGLGYDGPALAARVAGAVALVVVVVVVGGELEAYVLGEDVGLAVLFGEGGND